MDEPLITINGRQLTVGQAMTVRVAVASFGLELSDPSFIADLGPIGPAYLQRVRELETMLTEDRRTAGIEPKP